MKRKILWFVYLSMVVIVFCSCASRTMTEYETTTEVTTDEATTDAVTTVSYTQQEPVETPENTDDAYRKDKGIS